MVSEEDKNATIWQHNNMFDNYINISFFKQKIENQQSSNKYIAR